MDMNFVIAQIFGGLSMAASICSMQFKKRKHILIALLLLSLFSALNLALLDSFGSANITIFAILEMAINALFEHRKKPIPKFIIAFYVAANIALGVLSFTGPLDIIPILCALIFCAVLLARNEQDIRKLTLLNQSLWLIFDLSARAYVLSGSNVLTIISTAVALYRYRHKPATKSITKSTAKSITKPTVKSNQKKGKNERRN